VTVTGEYDWYVTRPRCSSADLFQELKDFFAPLLHDELGREKKRIAVTGIYDLERCAQFKQFVGKRQEIAAF
jgi:hypothetical protein